MGSVLFVEPVTRNQSPVSSLQSAGESKNREPYPPKRASLEPNFIRLEPGTENQEPNPTAKNNKLIRTKPMTFICRIT